LRGVQPKRINFDEPVPLERAINRPEWLSDLAAEEWNRVAPHLVAMRVVTEADLTALCVYCEAVARWRRLAELVARSAPVIQRDGGVVKNPLYSQVRDAATEVRVWAREFGLTPSARSGIRVEHVFSGDASRLLTSG
jgi:P27 family predicted phage terminase small subunit